MKKTEGPALKLKRFKRYLCRAGFSPSTRVRALAKFEAREKKRHA